MSISPSKFKKTFHLFPDAIYLIKISRGSTLLRKLHARDVLPRQMAQRTFCSSACAAISHFELRIALQQWLRGLPVLSEDEVKDRGYVYQHAQESENPRKYLGDGGQPAVDEQFDEACYEEVCVDDDDKRTDHPRKHRSLH